MKGEVKLTGTKKRMCSANFCGAGSTIIGSISLLQIFFINVLPPIFPSLFRFQILSRPQVSPGGRVGWGLGGGLTTLHPPTSASVMNVPHVAANAQYFFLQKKRSVISSDAQIRQFGCNSAFGGAKCPRKDQ